MENNTRCRRWFLTINHYTEEDCNLVEAYVLNNEAIYTAIGYHVGQQSEIEHVHILLCFENAIRFNSIKESWPRANIQKLKGTIEQALKYLRKDGHCDEFGEKPVGQGKRTDLDKIKEIVNDGGTMKDVIEVAANYQDLKSGEILIKYQNIKGLRPNLKVYWYWGDAGVGKSYKAYEQYPDAWLSPKDLKWFDGYYGQKEVIFEDFRGHFCPFSTLLRYLDIYPIRVETKGGSVPFRPEIIVVTSCYHPKDVYSNEVMAEGENLEQLLGRITEIVHFTGPNRRLQRIRASVDTEVGGNTRTPTSGKPKNKKYVETIIDEWDTYDPDEE